VSERIDHPYRGGGVNSKSETPGSSWRIGEGRDGDVPPRVARARGPRRVIKVGGEDGCAEEELGERLLEGESLEATVGGMMLKR